MSQPRIALKDEVTTNHDKLVFLLSDMLFDSAMSFIREYTIDHEHNEEKCIETHSILYNAVMNFAGRAVDKLSEAVETEDEQKAFIEQAKKHICTCIDIAKDLKKINESKMQ